MIETICRNYCSHHIARPNKRIASNKTVYLNAKLPALLSSLTQVTESLPNSAVSPRFGQYWWHFTRPRSTMVVSIMMREDWLSHVMYQKSVHVEANGPCVAIYLVLKKNEHYCKHNLSRKWYDDFDSLLE